MAEVKPFGEPISLEELSPARPAGRGRQRDVYYEEVGAIAAITENVGKLFPIYRDREGELPREDTADAKKRRGSAQTKLRRSLQAQDLKDNVRPIFRFRDGVLYAGLRELTADELRRRDEAAKKRAATRARG